MDAPEGAEAVGVKVVHGSDGTVALKAVAAREADVKTVAYFIVYCVFENVLFCSLVVLFLEIKSDFPSGSLPLYIISLAYEDQINCSELGMFHGIDRYETITWRWCTGIIPPSDMSDPSDQIPLHTDVNNCTIILA